MLTWACTTAALLRAGLEVRSAATAAAAVNDATHNSVWTDTADQVDDRTC